MPDSSATDDDEPAAPPASLSDGAVSATATPGVAGGGVEGGGRDSGAAGVGAGRAVVSRAPSRGGGPRREAARGGERDPDDHGDRDAESPHPAVQIGPIGL